MDVKSEANSNNLHSLNFRSFTGNQVNHFQISCDAHRTRNHVQGNSSSLIQNIIPESNPLKGKKFTLRMKIIASSSFALKTTTHTHTHTRARARTRTRAHTNEQEEHTLYLVYRKTSKTSSKGWSRVDLTGALHGRQDFEQLRFL